MSIYIDRTRAWVEHFVVGLSLCPFAQGPFHQGTIRYVLEETRDEEQLSQTLLRELLLLFESPSSEVETTLLIHPHVLTDFSKYLDFLGWVEDILPEAGLEGIIQVASFHPDYQFADTEVNDLGNFTNRSPFPMLHLLRESSVEWAVDHHPNIAEVPARNARLMQELGLEGLRKLMDKLWNE